MNDREMDNEQKDSAEKVKAPENMVVVNPDKPLYEVEHLCVYLSELPELSPDGQVLDNPSGHAELEE